MCIHLVQGIGNQSDQSTFLTTLRKTISALQKDFRSACALRFAYQKQASSIPSFRSGLNDLSTMIFAGFSILWMFICLMCVYQQLISRTEDLYRVCTMVMFVGTAVFKAY